MVAGTGPRPPLTDPAQETVLCDLADIEDGRARGFLPHRREDKVFAVRRGDEVFVYLNTCPHNWVGLDFAQDQFLSGDGREIVCYAHGAHFDVRSGECVDGICLGQFLIRVPHRIEAGRVVIPARLPVAPDG